MTVREKVWRMLKKRGPMAVYPLAEALGIVRYDCKHPSGRVSGAVSTLCRDGYARIVREGKSPVYEALGDTAPKDLRGYVRSSQLNVVKATAASAAARSRAIQPPKPATALEQCWGWRPQAFQDCADD